MWHKNLYKLRRKLFETIGSERYSRPSLYDIDKKLEKYLINSNGFLAAYRLNLQIDLLNLIYFPQNY